MRKVTALIIRHTERGRELLILQHPHAGWQLPAGTLEPGEDPAAGALREASEETGLTDLRVVEERGYEDTDLGSGFAFTEHDVPVYSRPDETSFQWAYIRHGLRVEVLRRAPGWVHLRFTEDDRWPDPTYATYQITGWAHEDAVAPVFRRHFFLLEPAGQTPERWTVYNDNHRFTLFWAPLVPPPPLIQPQAHWLSFLP